MSETHELIRQRRIKKRISRRFFAAAVVLLFVALRSAVIMGEKIMVLIGFILFAIFGTCVKWVNALKTQPTTWAILFIDIFTAAFVGCIIGSIYHWLHVNEGMAFAIAGISGYYGTKSVDLLQTYVVRKMGAELPQIPNDSGIVDTQIYSKQQKENET